MDYNNQNVKKLCFEFFEMERLIKKMQDKLIEDEKLITIQYKIKGEIYNLIKSKQIEEEEEENKMKE